MVIYDVEGNIYNAWNVRVNIWENWFRDLLNKNVVEFVRADDKKINATIVHTPERDIRINTYDATILLDANDRVSVVDNLDGYSMYNGETLIQNGTKYAAWQISTSVPTWIRKEIASGKIRLNLWEQKQNGGIHFSIDVILNKKASMTVNDLVCSFIIRDELGRLDATDSIRDMKVF